MRKKSKGLVALLLSLLMVISLLSTTGLTVEAAAKPKLAKKASNIVIGGTSKIKVKNAPKGAKITYKSAKKNIATVSKQGKVKGVKSGTTKITVFVKKNSKTTKLTYKVTVKKPKLSKSNLSLKSGNTAKISVKNKPKKAKYTWQSSNPKVTTVNKNGKVVAKAKGTANIKVKVKTSKKTYSLSCKVTVKSTSDSSNDVKQTYTVTFDSNGGNSVASQTVDKNTLATRPTDPTRSGYTFDGWFTAASGGQEFDFNTAITDNTTLYAHWTELLAILSSDKDIISVSEETEIVFYLSSNLELNNTVVKNENGDDVAYLHDDGLYSQNGDELQGDGIYTGKALIESSEETTLHFIAYFELDESVQCSNICDIKSFAQITEEESKKMEFLDDDLASIVASDRNLDERSSDVISALNESDIINHESIKMITDSHMIVFEYSSGVLGGVLLEESNDMVGGFQRNTDTNDLEGLSSNNLSAKNANNSNKFLEDFFADKRSVSNISATILYGWDKNYEGHLWWKKSTSLHEFYETLASEWESNYNMDVTLDDEVTVESLSTELSGQDLIVIACHGNYEYSNQPVVCLQEKPGWIKDMNYSDDLKAGNVVKVTTTEGKQYWIMPTFFTRHYRLGSLLQSSIIYMDNCMGLGNGDSFNYTLDTTLSDAFHRCGAASVIGYHNSVFIAYGAEIMVELVDHLMQGETVSVALEAAKNVHGNNDHVYAQRLINDGSWDRETVEEKENSDGYAVPHVAFGSDAVLIESGIQNKSFELSTHPSKWNVFGDVRILSQLGELQPTDESRMCIITTGIGSEEGASTSIVYQTFFVPQGTSSLKFDYDVVSEEPMEYIDSKYDDKFIAVLVNEEGKIISELASENINTSEWHEVSGIDFEDGDDTVFHTQWKTIQQNVLSNYGGQFVTLAFAVTDVGDSNYDTAVLIDGIETY